MSETEKADRRRARLRTLAAVAAWSGWVLAVLSLAIGGSLVRSLSRELRRLQGPEAPPAGDRPQFKESSPAGN